MNAVRLICPTCERAVIVPPPIDPANTTRIAVTCACGTVSEIDQPSASMWGLPNDTEAHATDAKLGESDG